MRADNAELTRQAVMRTTRAAGLAMLSLTGGEHVMAQRASPMAQTSLEGAWAVARVRKVKTQYMAADVSHSVAEGFVPIVRDVPALISYFVVADDEQNYWISIGIVAARAGADESPERARGFGQQGTDKMIDGEPIVIEGPMDIAAP